MIELTFKGSTLEEVFGAMRQALGGAEMKVSKADVEEAARKVADTFGADRFEETAEKVVTLDEIKTLAKAKMDEKKSKAIKGLLAEFGVAKVVNLAEDDYVAFYEKLEDL